MDKTRAAARLGTLIGIAIGLVFVGLLFTYGRAA